MYPNISISRKEMITLLCVARPTPTASSLVSNPTWHETVPITTPNTAAYRRPVNRSFSSAIDIALAMYCANGTLSCV